MSDFRTQCSRCKHNTRAHLRPSDSCACCNRGIMLVGDEERPAIDVRDEDEPIEPD